MTRGGRSGVGAAWLFLLVTWGCRTGGTPTVAIEPLGAVPPGGSPLSGVAFLTGCWRGSYGAGQVIEERWTPPAGQLMLSNTRFLRDGRVVDFEFGMLAAEDGAVLLTPYPRGNRSEHAFRLTAGGAGRAVFEAPEHDYPKRILYQLLEDGRLLARIDGGADDLEPRSWSLDPVSCP